MQSPFSSEMHFRLAKEKQTLSYLSERNCISLKFIIFSLLFNKSIIIYIENMNSLELLAEFFRLTALGLILYRLLTSKMVQGISYKTLEIMAIAFLLKYSDVVFDPHWRPLFMNVIRVTFVALSLTLVLCLRFKK